MLAPPSTCNADGHVVTAPHVQEDQDHQSPQKEVDDLKVAFDRLFEAGQIGPLRLQLSDAGFEARFWVVEVGLGGAKALAECHIAGEWVVDDLGDRRHLLFGGVALVELFLEGFEGLLGDDARNRDPGVTSGSPYVAGDLPPGVAPGGASPPYGRPIALVHRHFSGLPDGDDLKADRTHDVHGPCYRNSYWRRACHAWCGWRECGLYGRGRRGRALPPGLLHFLGPAEAGRQEHRCQNGDDDEGVPHLLLLVPTSSAGGRDELLTIVMR